MNTRIRSQIIGIVITGLLALTHVSAIAETEIKAISFLPKDHKLCAMIPTWIERVNTAL